MKREQCGEWLRRTTHGIFHEGFGHTQNVTDLGEITVSEVPDVMKLKPTDSPKMNIIVVSLHDHIRGSAPLSQEQRPEGCSDTYSPTPGQMKTEKP